MARKIEDFYDRPAPVEIALFGGPHDGMVLSVDLVGGGYSGVLELDEPGTAPNPFNTFVTRQPPPKPGRRVAYRWNGSIRDDGARVYQVIP